MLYDVYVPVYLYFMLFSVYIVYVTDIAFMCFANKHIIIIKKKKKYKKTEVVTM
jgi:hypothetical protein